MSELCNRICAIVILTLGGYLITLPAGSATATSTIQFTTGISSTTSAENRNITTQGNVLSTAKSDATTVPSASTIGSISTLETSTTSPKTESVDSTEASEGGYSTFLTNESSQQTLATTINENVPSTEGLSSPYHTTSSEGSTEHLTTVSIADMSTVSTESLTTYQGSTLSTMGDGTSPPEIPSTFTDLPSDQDTSTFTEMVTSITTLTETHIASAGPETSPNMPDSVTTLEPKLETEASTMNTSASSTMNNPEGLSTTEKKVGTTAGSTPTTATSIPTQTFMSTTSEAEKPVESTPRVTTTPQNDRSSSITPKPATPPPYPARYLADIDSEEAVKKIKIEIEVLEESSENCVPGNSKSCEDFMDTVKVELEKHYRNIEGFLKVEVTKLRNGSIIVEHNVSYEYSKMKSEDKYLSAEQVYDKTVGPGVADGNLGDLNVSTCDNCSQPQDCTDLCHFMDSVDCDVYVASCTEGYVYCISPCENNPSFCSSRGNCHQDEGVAAKCSCNSVDNGFYYGDNCERYFNQTVMIICIAVAGGFIFGIAVACVVTRCRRKKTLGRYRQYYTDDMGEEGYLCGQAPDSRTPIFLLSKSSRRSYNPESVGLAFGGSYYDSKWIMSCGRSGTKVTPWKEP